MLQLTAHASHISNPAFWMPLMPQMLPASGDDRLVADGKAGQTRHSSLSLDDEIAGSMTNQRCRYHRFAVTRHDSISAAAPAASAAPRAPGARGAIAEDLFVSHPLVERYRCYRYRCRLETCADGNFVEAAASSIGRPDVLSRNDRGRHLGQTRYRDRHRLIGSFRYRRQPPPFQACVH